MSAVFKRGYFFNFLDSDKLVQTVFSVEFCLTHYMLGNFACSFCYLLIFSLRYTIRVSISLGPDQVQQNVWPDLGPNCLQRLSTDRRAGDKSLDGQVGDKSIHKLELFFYEKTDVSPLLMSKA